MRFSIDGKVVFQLRERIDISPAKRECGLSVPELRAMAAYDGGANITFGLENLKWDKHRIQARVRRTPCHAQDRAVYQEVSQRVVWGQQQRVAIARTLATGPKVFVHG